jgi:N-formylglutamate amidohydrolase
MWKIRYESRRLVSRHSGTLPIVLTCPHDGAEAPVGVRERTGTNTDCKHFTTLRDLHTREVTEGVAQRLLELSGEAPYVVIAGFSRRYIDANRSPECAYEVDAAEQYHAEYHRTIRSFIDEIRAENGGLGLLFDFHGTRTAGADVFLGTNNGSTVDQLVQADPAVMWRRRGLRGLLQAAGLRVQPETPNERESLDGGYTVTTYGSSTPSGLNAIQLELGAPVRKEPSRRQELIDVLAHAIRSVGDRYARADVTSASAQVRLLGGESITGFLAGQQRSADSVLRVGGAHQHRGRVEIGNDPGLATEPETRRAGVLVLQDEAGHPHYLWVDNRGELRVSSDDPEGRSLSGTIVGTQGDGQRAE